MAGFPPPLLEVDRPPAPVVIAAPMDEELRALLLHDYAVAELEDNWSTQLTDQTPRLAAAANPYRVGLELVLVTGGVTIYHAGRECNGGWDAGGATPGSPLVAAGASYLYDRRYTGPVWLVAEGGFPIDVRITEWTGKYPWPSPVRRRR